MQRAASIIRKLNCKLQTTSLGRRSVLATTGTHALYVHTHIHTNKMSLLIASSVCPILTQSLLKKNNNVTFQTMPPYAVHCAACAANKSLLSVSRHWTGCSCHCRFFTLLARPELLNNSDLLGNTDAIFFPNRPSPFHFSHPSLPSLCPLLGLQFLSRVCLTLPWQQRQREAASTLFFSLILVGFFFLSLCLSFSVLCRATVVEWTAPWQHWQLKTCICLSCTLSVCFSFLSSFFCSSRWMSCRQGCQGSRWLQERKRKQNCRRKKNKTMWTLWRIPSTVGDGAKTPHI